MALKGSKKETEEKVKTFEAPTETVADDVIDIDLSPIQKKAFRIDGDNNRVIRLNTSDLNIASRLEKAYPELIHLVNEASERLETIEASQDDKDTETIALLAEIDKKMRDWIDYVFDEKVADKAVPNGSMYDPFNGKFAFEYVLDKLGNLYGESFARERRLMQKRMEKHTSKYTGTK